jgi:hypothetical protein
LRSNDSAPRPPPLLYPARSCLSSLPVCRRSSLLRGGRGGRGAKSYDREKAWPYIIHLKLSGSEKVRVKRYAKRYAVINTHRFTCIGASKIKLKKVNKKRTVTVRGVIIFMNISRRPLRICLHCCLHQYKTLQAVATAMVVIVLLTPAKNLNKVF